MRLLLASVVLVLAAVTVVPAPASACHVILADPWEATDDLPWAEFVWDECGDPRMGVCVHDDAWTKCVWIIK